MGDQSNSSRKEFKPQLSLNIETPPIQSNSSRKEFKPQQVAGVRQKPHESNSSRKEFKTKFVCVDGFNRNQSKMKTSINHFGTLFEYFPIFTILNLASSIYPTCQQFPVKSMKL